jgi:hypothetical protein
LSLPHANVNVERIFSSVNLIKTKTRNRLNITIVRSLLKVKEGVKSGGGCVTFSPPSELKQAMIARNLYHVSDSSESDVEV